MIDVSHQLKAAPRSFEKTISQHARTRIHVDRITNPRSPNGPLITVGHLNRKGRRKQEALARCAERRAFRRAAKA